MNKIPMDSDLATILARLDRSSPGALLNSIAAELLRLHQAHLSTDARIHALEVTRTLQDQIASSGDNSVFASMPATVTIEATFSLSTKCGFYYLEYDANGAPFRWTGPEPAFFFEVFVERKAQANIRMRFSQIYSKGAQQPVQCYIDGNEIKATLVEVDGEYEVHGVLAARDATGGTVVTFVCPRVSSPAAAGQSQDQRQLGLAFRWFRIEPGDNNLLPSSQVPDPLNGLVTEVKAEARSKLRRRAPSVPSTDLRK